MLSFGELYETYAASVYRFALWVSGDRFEADCITSEAFARAWSSRAPIRTSTVRAYLFAIARNTYLERRRKRKHEVDLADDPSSHTPGLVGVPA